MRYFTAFIMIIALAFYFVFLVQFSHYRAILMSNVESYYKGMSYGRNDVL